MEEKRKFVRIELPVILQYNILNGLSGRGQALCSNISEGGASFTASSRLRKGETLKIELYSPFGNGLIFKDVNVVWVREEDSREYMKFRVGIAFPEPMI
ncbi:MAG: PilZ domain-containing protein [Candidatus Omnitrophota bacterium]